MMFDCRLLSDHFDCDPATLSESQVRDYFLHVKTVKHWKPKTIRQAAACGRLFFVEQLGHQDWTVFSQIRARDQDRLPAVMTRDQAPTSSASTAATIVPARSAGARPPWSGCSGN
jgi:hypothetical protein